ncbi:alpha/beta fold hydrolase [Nonomuraea africana]|uniref:Pimeloyl-ACP methyl ester carboxylesterase n=1 Tax=Nonomuraea africana TaxID=46171 RepID=A0ABR9K926_9ACTN|nr:alpha/beta fold hydrolase [Nonomuraea africana]MBE1558504.1 pimeloyl-ACP methyl ester carboxylesterase [Nonomuraea africana]
MIRTAHVNGIDLSFREEGDPAAPALVLLHGRTADHNHWNLFTRRFAARFHVIAPDLRGHGASARPAHYALPDMAEDIVALLGALGVEQAVLIGHSLGGVVAYHLAMNHPERVSLLVLEDPPAPVPHARPPLQDDTPMMVETERQIVDPDPAWAEGLKRVTAPTLVLAGGPSSHVIAEPLADLIPGAKLVTIPVGHLIHGDAPEEFWAAVQEFLE